MKKISMWVLALAFALTLSQAAFAKTVSGTISEVDATGNKLVVNTQGAAGGVEKAEIWVNADAQFSGIKAINELKAGDKVSVEAQEEAGNWKATSVTKEAAKA